MEQYTEFKELLRGTVGDMSQKEFSEITGISREHLNRMLNSEIINRPSKTTLRKIIKAAPFIDIRKLYASCGYEEDGCYSFILGARKGFTLKERLGLAANDIRQGFQKMIGTMETYNTKRDLIHEYLEHQTGELKEIQFEGDREKDKPLELPCVKGDYFLPCIGHWVIPKGDVYDYIKTYFALAYIRTSKNEILLTDVIIEPSKLLLLGMIHEADVDSLYEDGIQIEELTSFSIVQTKERTIGTAEARLLKAIFGEDRSEEDTMTLYDTEFGIGSYYEKTPDGFVDFVLKNKKYFSQTEEEVEIVEELMDNPQCDPDVVCKEYSHFKAEGTAGVVLAILERKFEDMKCGFEISYDESEAYKDVLKPVFYVNEDYYSTGAKLDNQKRFQIKALLMEEFRTLKLPTFGGIMVYKAFDYGKEEYRNEQKPLE